MKRFILPIAILAMTACAEEIQNPNDLIEDATYYVSLDPDTKVQLERDEINVWTEGDLLSVFNKNDANEKWKFRGQTGDHNGEIGRLEQVNPGNDIDRIVIVYPYKEGYVLYGDEHVIYTTLSDTQTYMEDSYGLGDNTMIATGNTDNFLFRNVFSMLKLTLIGEGTVKQIKFYGNDYPRLAGPVKMNYEDFSIEFIDAPSEGGDDLEATLADDSILYLNCEEGVRLHEELTTNFYITLVPQTFKEGFTIEVITEEGWTYKKTTVKEVDFTRNVMNPFAKLYVENEELPEGTPLVATTELEIGSDGGKIDIPIYGDVYYDYSIVEGGDWISASRAHDENILIASVSKNETYDARVGKIYVKGAGQECTITITQSQLDELIVTAKEYDVDTAGGEVSIPVLSNVDYDFSVISGEGWISAKKVQTKGLKESILIAAVSANPEYDARVGQIKISGAGKESVVTITQHQLDEVIVESSYYEVEPEEVTVSIPVSANVQYTCEIPDEAKDWISYQAIQTKGLEESELLLKVKKNPILRSREANVKIIGADKEQSITINQKEAIYGYLELSEGVYLANLENGGDLEDIIIDVASNIQKLIIKGNINCVDITFLRYMCDNYYLTEIDLQDAKIVAGEKYDYMYGTGVAGLEDYMNRGAFYECATLESISLPTSLKTIGEFCFSECANLKEVKIMSSSIHVGARAFMGCRSLTEIDLPSKSTFDMGAFSGCGFKVLNIPEGITEFATDCFSCCGSLEEVHLPSTLKYVNDFCFALTHIKTIVIPEGVTRLGARAFSQCDYLEQITLPSTLTKIDIECFFLSPALKEIIIPDMVSEISNRAFSSCTGLTSVIIPESVKLIGEYAFEYCTSLSEIHMESATPPELNYGLISDDMTSTLIYVPIASLTKYKSAPGWSNHKDIIVGYDD